MHMVREPSLGDASLILAFGANDSGNYGSRCIDDDRYLCPSGHMRWVKEQVHNPYHGAESRQQVTLSLLELLL